MVLKKFIYAGIIHAMIDYQPAKNKFRWGCKAQKKYADHLIFRWNGLNPIHTLVQTYVFLMAMSCIMFMSHADCRFVTSLKALTQLLNEFYGNGSEGRRCLQNNHLLVESRMDATSPAARSK